MLNTTDLRRPISSTNQLEDVAKCLRNIIFRRELLGRCDLIMARSGSMDVNVRGYTAVTSRCYVDQMVHRIKIAINPDEHPVHFDKPFLTSISTILHEMCHAFTFIFVDRRPLTPVESIIYIGIKGYGFLWAKLYRAAAFLLERLGCRLDAVPYSLDGSVRTEIRTRREAIRRWRDVSQRGPGLGGTPFRLEHELHISPRDTTVRLPRLIQEGRDYFEIILVLEFGRWKGDWRNPIRNNSRPDPTDKPNRGNITADEENMMLQLCPNLPLKREDCN